LTACTIELAYLFSREKVGGCNDRLEFGRMCVAAASACALCTSSDVQIGGM
jgi:hypothetical protein